MRLLKVALAFGGELALNVSAIAFYEGGGAKVDADNEVGGYEVENGNNFLKIDTDAAEVRSMIEVGGSFQEVFKFSTRFSTCGDFFSTRPAQ